MSDLAFDWTAMLWGLSAVLVSFVLTTVVAILAVATLPARLFREPNSRAMFQSKHPVMRWAWLIGKNLIGYPLIVLGAVLALPGVPGPGLLLILIGVVLIDFPRKYWAVTRSLDSAKVLRSINRLRKRFGQPPVMLNAPGHDHREPRRSKETLE